MTTAPPSQPDTISTTTTSIADEPTMGIVTTGSTYVATITTTPITALPIRAEATTTVAAINNTPNTDSEEMFTEKTPVSSTTTTESAAFDVCGAADCEHLCRETEDEKSECFCQDGYILAEDGKMCDDVDECSDGSNGGCEWYCWNVPGSFQCLCSKGFILEDNGKTCKGNRSTSM